MAHTEVRAAKRSARSGAHPQLHSGGTAAREIEAKAHYEARDPCGATPQRQTVRRVERVVRGWGARAGLSAVVTNRSTMQIDRATIDAQGQRVSEATLSAAQGFLIPKPGALTALMYSSANNLQFLMWLTPSRL